MKEKDKKYLTTGEKKLEQLTTDLVNLYTNYAKYIAIIKNAQVQYQELFTTQLRVKHQLDQISDTELKYAHVAPSHLVSMTLREIMEMTEKDSKNLEEIAFRSYQLIAKISFFTQLLDNEFDLNQDVTR